MQLFRNQIIENKEKLCIFRRMNDAFLLFIVWIDSTRNR